MVIVVMYSMYLLSDIFGYHEWKKSYEWVEPEVVSVEAIEQERKIQQKREAKQKELKEKSLPIAKESVKKNRSETDPQIFA